MLEAEGHRLLNMTAGGDGVTGHVHNKETRLRISQKTKAAMSRPEVKAKTTGSGSRGKPGHHRFPVLTEAGEYFSSGEEFAKAYGVSPATVSMAASGKVKKSRKLPPFKLVGK